MADFNNPITQVTTTDNDGAWGRAARRRPEWTTPDPNAALLGWPPCWNASHSQAAEASRRVAERCVPVLLRGRAGGSRAALDGGQGAAPGLVQRAQLGRGAPRAVLKRGAKRQQPTLIRLAVTDQRAVRVPGHCGARPAAAGVAGAPQPQMPRVGPGRDACAQLVHGATRM